MLVKNVLTEVLAMYRPSCKGCKHRVKISTSSYCNYIIDMNEPRGCDVENCDKYEKGSAMKPIQKEIYWEQFQ